MTINFIEHEKIPQFSRCDFLDLCILGETGTGKSHLAQVIHSLSPRAHQPFVSINCAELPPSLFESELFGYRKGAFTGAVSDKNGVFQAAEKGTLFLDEIGELNPEMQAKLLKVVEEKRVTPVGGVVPRRIDLRIIYATNRDLSVIREDLRFRIAAHAVRLKPLRERQDEIVPLAEKFINDFSQKSGRKFLVSKNTLGLLSQFNWLGNIRELRSFIERVCLDALFNSENEEGNFAYLEITRHLLYNQLRKNENHGDNPANVYEEFENSSIGGIRAEVKEFESHLIIGVLRKNRRNITHAALELGLSRFGLIKKIKRFGINPKTC